MKRARAAVFKGHLRLYLHMLLVRIKRINQRSIFFGNNSPAHFSSTRQFSIISIEFFVQNDEPLNLMTEDVNRQRDSR